MMSGWRGLGVFWLVVLLLLAAAAVTLEVLGPLETPQPLPAAAAAPTPPQPQQPASRPPRRPSRQQRPSLRCDPGATRPARSPTPIRRCLNQ